MIAIVEAYHAGLLRLNQWRANLFAGVIVGIVALPLAMAFAIASGVKPEQGLYTAIIAGFCVAVFGGSRVQVAGPTGAFVVILAGITAHYGVAGLQIATLMAGLILILMGVIRLGSVIKFIPDPVITGFTSGIGFIIFIGEWKDFFGLSVSLPLDASFYQKILSLLIALPHFSITTTSLAILSLILVLIAPRFLKYIPGPLVAMLVVTVLQATFHFQGVATLGSAFGAIPRYLPALQFPSISYNTCLELVGPAFTIALLGAIESLLSATAADGMAGTRHHSNQELIGQGIANIVAPLFGGFAATGAIARTATNIRNGGNSPLSAITHSIVLLLIMVIAAPLAANIPLCALAAILFVVAYNMSDIPHFYHTLTCAPRDDVLVLLVSFFLTVFTNLVIAVNVGVILAMMLFIRKMTKSVNIERHTHESLRDELLKDNIQALPPNTMVYSIQGPLFFGAAEKIEHVLAVTHTDPKNMILRFTDVPFIDMTGLEVLAELVEQYRLRGVRVYLCEANAKVSHKLKKAKLLELVNGKMIYATLGSVCMAILGDIMTKEAD